MIEVHDHVWVKGHRGEYEVVALTTDEKGVWVCSTSDLKRHLGLVEDRAFVTHLSHLTEVESY